MRRYYSDNLVVDHQPLRLVEVYEYIDRPLVFTTIDSAGQLYFVMWSEAKNTSDVWVYTPITAAEFGDLRSKKKSFRHLMTEPELKFSVIMEVERKNGESLVDVRPASAIEARWLPSSNSYLEDEDLEELVPLEQLKIALRRPEYRTFTDVLENNRVWVVQNVPVLVENSDEVDAVAFIPWYVFIRLNKLRKTALEKPADRAPVCMYWDEEGIQVKSHLEVVFEGPGVSTKNSDLNTWKAAFEHLATSYDRGAEGLYTATQVQPPIPKVQYIREGSIAIGLQLGQQQPLFPYAESYPQSLEVFRLFSLAADWISLGPNSEWPKEFREKPELADAILAALEELAPSSGTRFKSVRIIPTSTEAYKSVRETKLDISSRPIIQKTREWLRHLSEETRTVAFIGVIDSLRYDQKLKRGRLRLNHLDQAPLGWTKRTVEFTYDDSKYFEVLQALSAGFGREKVRATLEQQKVNDKWQTSYQFIRLIQLTLLAAERLSIPSESS